MKTKGSRSKQRHNARQKKYFYKDTIQPFDPITGKPNREFIKVYGKKIYGKDAIV